MKYQRGYTLTELLFVVIVVLGGIGWTLNIVWVFMNMSAALTGTFVLSVVGIFFFPLGMILGWIHTLFG